MKNTRQNQKPAEPRYQIGETERKLNDRMASMELTSKSGTPAKTPAKQTHRRNDWTLDRRMIGPFSVHYPYSERNFYYELRLEEERRENASRMRMRPYFEQFQRRNNNWQSDRRNSYRLPTVNQERPYSDRRTPNSENRDNFPSRNQNVGRQYSDRPFSTDVIAQESPPIVIQQHDQKVQNVEAPTDARGDEIQSTSRRNDVHADEIQSTNDEKNEQNLGLDMSIPRQSNWRKPNYPVSRNERRRMYSKWRGDDLDAFYRWKNPRSADFKRRTLALSKTENGTTSDVTTSNSQPSTSNREEIKVPAPKEEKEVVVVSRGKQSKDCDAKTANAVQIPSLMENMIGAPGNEKSEESDAKTENVVQISSLMKNLIGAPNEKSKEGDAKSVNAVQIPSLMENVIGAPGNEKSGETDIKTESVQIQSLKAGADSTPKKPPGRRVIRIKEGEWELYKAHLKVLAQEKLIKKQKSSTSQASSSIHESQQGTSARRF